MLMNENTQMLYKYPGDMINIRVEQGGDRFGFDTKLVPLGSKEEGWYKTPQEAVSPPQVFEIKQPMPQTIEHPFEPGAEVESSTKSSVDEVTIPEDEPAILSDDEEFLEEFIEEKDPFAEYNGLMSEVEAIKGNGAKKKLRNHAKKHGFSIKGNYNAMKKDYIDQLKEKYGVVD